ncbi:MAG: hypothetical protein ACKPKO_01610, partial [Candidatus Fonsibacter sp.]
KSVQASPAPNTPSTEEPLEINGLRWVLAVVPQLEESCQGFVSSLDEGLAACHGLLSSGALG